MIKVIFYFLLVSIGAGLVQMKIPLFGRHSKRQNVGVDACGFACLCHLDVYVFDEVGIKFVHLQLELQLRQEILVASDRGDEVGKGVLQAAQANQALIVYTMIEVSFCLFYERIDLFQSLQIPNR